MPYTAQPTDREIEFYEGFSKKIDILNISQGDILREDMDETELRGEFIRFYECSLSYGFGFLVLENSNIPSLEWPSLTLYLCHSSVPYFLQVELFTRHHSPFIIYYHSSLRVGRDLLPNPSVLSLLLVSCSLLAPHLAPASPGKLAVRLQLGHIRLQLVLKPCSRFLSVLALHFVLAHAYDCCSISSLPCSPIGCISNSNLDQEIVPSTKKKNTNEALAWTALLASNLYCFFIIVLCYLGISLSSQAELEKSKHLSVYFCLLSLSCHLLLRSYYLLRVFFLTLTMFPSLLEGSSVFQSICLLWGLCAGRMGGNFPIPIPWTGPDPLMGVLKADLVWWGKCLEHFLDSKTGNGGSQRGVGSSLMVALPATPGPPALFRPFPPQSLHALLSPLPYVPPETIKKKQGLRPPLSSATLSVIQENVWHKNFSLFIRIFYLWVSIREGTCQGIWGRVGGCSACSHFPKTPSKHILGTYIVHLSSIPLGSIEVYPLAPANLAGKPYLCITSEGINLSYANQATTLVSSSTSSKTLQLNKKSFLRCTIIFYLAYYSVKSMKIKNETYMRNTICRIRCQFKHGENSRGGGYEKGFISFKQRHESDKDNRRERIRWVEDQGDQLHIDTNLHERKRAENLLGGGKGRGC
ncbi:hypothetical protein VP01_1228g2 [Puccinia sorghi]|uniref:Uncharacterized protein n=1 Tax=Puccinia sorghi TaxID=27349 RepID=A0A0L6VQ36_9BASI|nr:hypothetical protein VP01_1228g2 [Puccinia sorghi]